MAAEFAYIFQTFGSRVTVLSRSGFLKDLDKHLRAIALKELDGVDIREGTAVTGIAGTSQVTGVRYRAGGTEAETEGGAVLLAAGLIPNSGMVSGIDKGPGGEILTNDRMQTSVPGIYACGDVAGAPFLTPVARHEGLVAADNILGKERHMDYTHIPQAIFLAHELAFCGRWQGERIAGPSRCAGPGTYWSVPYGDTGLAKILADPGLRRDYRHVRRGAGGRRHRRVSRVSHAAAYIRARLRGVYRSPPVHGRGERPREVCLGTVQETGCFLNFF